MDGNKEINTIVDNVILTIDNKFKGEDVPQNLLDYLYMSTVGLCISLGENYVDDIFNAINKVSFTNKLDFSTDKKYLVLSSFGSNFEINYQFYIRDKKSGNINTLEFITKELINLLCSESNTNDLNDQLVGEVLKKLEIEDTVNTIINLRDFDIENKRFKKAIKGFEDFNLDEYSVSGYETIVNLFRPLFKFDVLKELFISNLIDGHYYNIYEEFDYTLGANAFENMINSLRSINNKLNKKNIPTYTIACSYLNIRNKFVQNYINLKFN